LAALTDRNIPTRPNRLWNRWLPRRFDAELPTR